MKTIAAALTVCIAAVAPARAQPTPSTAGATTMEISRNGTRLSVKGPAEYFTGSVRIDPLFDARDPARASAASVTFEPGARTAWHRHPRGPVFPTAIER